VFVFSPAQYYHVYVCGKRSNRERFRAFLQTLHGVRAGRRRVLAEEQRASELGHGAARSSSGGRLRDERARARAWLGCGVARSSLVGGGGSWSRAAAKQCCFSKPRASVQIDEQERWCCTCWFVAGTRRRQRELGRGRNPRLLSTEQSISSVVEVSKVDLLETRKKGNRGIAGVHG
jgi:hypothetical protein